MIPTNVIADDPLPLEIEVDLTWTHEPGDYVQLDGAQIGALTKEDIEEDEFWDQVILNSYRIDSGFYYLSDEPCNFGNYSGDCHVREMRMGLDLTLINTTYSVRFDIDYLVNQSLYRAFSGDWREIVEEYYEDSVYDFGMLGGREAVEIWENITTTFWEIGAQDILRTGDSFIIQSENWENSTYVEIDENGTRYEDSGTDYYWENVSFTGVQTFWNEFDGYNEAEGGSSPTSIQVMEVDVHNITDDGSTGELLGKYLYSEWGSAVGMYFDAENSTGLVEMLMWNHQGAPIVDTDGDGCPDESDSFPEDSTECSDFDLDGIGDNADTDDDNDGALDDDEINCNTDQYDQSSYPIDTDGDGICDEIDSDDDDDGVRDLEDDFPLDSSEWEDSDSDGIGNNADTDDDNDGVLDTLETDCGTDPLNSLEFPVDLDGDGECDALDTDDDGDGYDDDEDVFPRDNSEWADYDSDDIGDNADTDDDNDLWLDSDEIDCSTDQFDADSYPIDTDGDSLCNAVDIDDDGDKWADAFDKFPLDSSEWADVDEDGIGDNADLDDDGDGWLDADEEACEGDSLDASVTPADNDGDMLCDGIDPDDDNDGYVDDEDAFPFDAGEHLDSDGDGIGNEADLDDDNDGLSDVDEIALGTNPLLADSDSDGVLDGDDAFPLDSSESKDSDNDGTGDNSDKYPSISRWQTSTDMIIDISLIAIVLIGLLTGTILMMRKGKGKSAESLPQDHTHHVATNSAALYTDEQLLASGWSQAQIDQMRSAD